MNPGSAPAEGPKFTIGTLPPRELKFALDLAQAEGWQPGTHDVVPFGAADAEGFLAGELDGERVGCISAVRYAGFGFIGLYIVRKTWRGQGYGRALWDRAIERLGSLPIGLDGVLAQQAFYERAGFKAAYKSYRYQMDAIEPRERYASQIVLVPLHAIPEDLAQYDRACFGTSRGLFLDALVAAPSTVALAARDIVSGRLLGFGMGRPCSEGTRIGPLFSARIDVAAVLFDAIATRTRSPWFLDIPGPNLAALGFADMRGMKLVFETVRMWRGDPPQLSLGDVYGVTSFELG